MTREGDPWDYWDSEKTNQLRALIPSAKKLCDPKFTSKTANDPVVTNSPNWPSKY